MEIKLTNVGQVIAVCWSQAEAETIRTVREKYWRPAEEQITFLFASELRVAVETASSAHKFEHAFAKDLQSIMPRVRSNIGSIAKGLIARVNLHNRPHESKMSGADFGLIIKRPLLTVTSNRMRVETRRDQATGLLAQAKLDRRTSATSKAHTWHFKKSQAILFSDVKDYYSFLLYRLSGQVANDLAPFGWQLCKGFTVDQVREWLRSDCFPQETLSSDIISRLVAREIGTEDPTIIASIVDPNSDSTAQSIEIQVSWPDGQGPPPSLTLRNLEQQVPRIRIIQH